MIELQLEKKYRAFQTWTKIFSHYSQATQSLMRFAIITPDLEKRAKLPCIFWLSGLTCSEQNFISKAGAQRLASQYRAIVVVPDTSPRGVNIPDHDSYDLGQGAGFYLNATQSPWKNNFQMYDYISQELYQIVLEHFPIHSGQLSIMGHSMGGHGALVIGLREPQRFCSISAFSPISSPSHCPWGKKAFHAYLGADQEAWKSYDASFLVETSPFEGKILIDQGLADEFLEEQLLPQKLIEASESNPNIDLLYRTHDDYDHSYYFISSFLEDHFRFHLK